MRIHVAFWPSYALLPVTLLVHNCSYAPLPEASGPLQPCAQTSTRTTFTTLNQDNTEFMFENLKIKQACRLTIDTDQESMRLA